MGEDVGGGGAIAVAIGASGNIYVAGYTESFGAGRADALLLKYSPDGDLIWARTWGGPYDDKGHAVAVDNVGDVYVAGHSSIISGVNTHDVLILKYDSSGELIWQETWDGGDWDFAYAIAVEDDGDVFIAGETREDPWTSDALLLKYDSSGTLLWKRAWGGSAAGNAVFYDIAVDEGGNIHAAGYIWSFAPGGMTDVLVVKFDVNGNPVWGKTWGGSDEGIEDLGAAIALDGSGNVYVAGMTRKDSQPVGAGQEYVLLLKYDSSGRLMSQNTWGGSDYYRGHAIAVDASGMLYLGGSAPRNYGPWQDVNGETFSPSDEFYTSTPDGSLSTPDGTETNPDGTTMSPDGVEDEGGGYGDALIMKLDPSKL